MIAQTQNEVKAIGGYHPITVHIIQILSKGNPGDEITDSELSETVGILVGVGEKGYGYLMNAIKHCEKSGIAWQRVPCAKKILCLNALEKVEQSGDKLKRIRKISRRSAQVLSSVAPDDLPSNERGRAMALSAQLGAISIMSRIESTKKLIGGGQSTPQIGDAFKLFEK